MPDTTGDIYRVIKESPDDELLSKEIQDRLGETEEITLSEEMIKKELGDICSLEMMRRLKNEILNLNETFTSSNSRIAKLTYILIGVAIIQVIVMILQVVLLLSL